MAFNVGDTFSSWSAVMERKKLYEEKYKVELWIRDSRTLKSAMKNCPIKAGNANPELKYIFTRLCCRSGGRLFKSHGVGLRQSRTSKINCPMMIRLNLSEDGQHLVVATNNSNHNHDNNEVLRIKRNVTPILSSEMDGEMPAIDTEPLHASTSNWLETSFHKSSTDGPDIKMEDKISPEEFIEEVDNDRLLEGKLQQQSPSIPLKSSSRNSQYSEDSCSTILEPFEDIPTEYLSLADSPIKNEVLSSSQVPPKDMCESLQSWASTGERADGTDYPLPGYSNCLREGLLRYYVVDDYLHDAYITTASQLVLSAHRIVLAASSPVLHNIFSVVPEVKEVLLDEFGYNDLKNVIDAMYTGMLRLGPGNIHNVTAIVEKLKIAPMILICQQFVRKHVKPVAALGVHANATPIEIMPTCLNNPMPVVASNHGNGPSDLGCDIPIQQSNATDTSIEKKDSSNRLSSELKDLVVKQVQEALKSLAPAAVEEELRRESLLSRSQKKAFRRSRHSPASTSSSSSSMEDSTESEGGYKGESAKRLQDWVICCNKSPNRKVRVKTLTRNSIQGMLQNPRPTDTLSRLKNLYTGIKGVPESICRVMDSDIHLTDEMKLIENVLIIAQRGVLEALSASAPLMDDIIVNEQQNDLEKHLIHVVEALAATSAFITMERYGNINMHATTEACHEVTKQVQVTDHLGKRLSIFKSPDPVMGKPYDARLLFGGQMPILMKNYDSVSKIGLTVGTKRNATTTAQFISSAKKSRMNFFRRRQDFLQTPWKKNRNRISRFRSNKLESGESQANSNLEPKESEN